MTQTPLLVAKNLAQHYPVKRGMFAKSQLLRAVDGVQVEHRKTGDLVEIEWPDKCAVIDRLAKMLGLYSPEKLELSGSVTQEAAALTDAELERQLTELRKQRGPRGGA